MVTIHDGGLPEARAASEVRRSGDPGATLPAMLDRAVQRFRDKPAIDFFGRSWTDRLAAGLGWLGVARGVRVGLCLPNTPHFVLLYFMVLMAGFVVIHAGQRTSPEALRSFLAERISKIEMPAQIEIRTSLPRTMVGNLSKKERVAEERGQAALAAAHRRVSA